MLASEVASLASVLFAWRNGVKAVACLPLEVASAFVAKVERAAGADADADADADAADVEAAVR